MKGTYNLTVHHVGCSRQDLFYRLCRLIVDKAKPTMTSRFLVHHQSRIGNISIRSPKGAEPFLSTVEWNSSHEKLVGFGRGSPVRFGDGSLGINLDNS